MEMRNSRAAYRELLAAADKTLQTYSFFGKGDAGKFQGKEKATAAVL